MNKFDVVERTSVVSMMHDPKRVRPQFIRELDMDKVVDALLRLTMEISVIRDRLDIYEALGEQCGITDAAIESFKATPEIDARRRERRERLIRGVISDLR
ncbi:MAG TPA: hypothetical protein P5528_01325 [Steroidobacteraceae bacterium]|nr:hypothetical protein [Steroidobacteraceae bacterium]